MTVRRESDPDRLRIIHGELLAHSFPPEELAPVEWLVDGVASGQLRVLVSGDSEVPDAVSVTEQLLPSRAVLLAYLAAAAATRGQGLGAQVYAETLRVVRSEDAPHLILAEVERPDRHEVSAAHGDPQARLRFYGRLGARVLDVPYFQPPIAEGREPVHGLLLLALWVDPVLVSADGSHLLDSTVVAEGVAAMLGPTTSDPRTDSSEARLRAASQVPHVRVLDVADFAEVPLSD